MTSASSNRGDGIRHAPHSPHPPPGSLLAPTPLAPIDTIHYPNDHHAKTIAKGRGTHPNFAWRLKNTPKSQTEQKKKDMARTFLARSCFPRILGIFWRRGRSPLVGLCLLVAPQTRDPRLDRSSTEEDTFALGLPRSTRLQHPWEGGIGGPIPGGPGCLWNRAKRHFNVRLSKQCCCISDRNRRMLVGAAMVRCGYHMSTRLTSEVLSHLPGNTAQGPRQHTTVSQPLLQQLCYPVGHVAPERPVEQALLLLLLLLFFPLPSVVFLGLCPVLTTTASFLLPRG